MRYNRTYLAISNAVNVSLAFHNIADTIRP